MDVNSFIFEDSSSSFMCCDAVTSQCSKAPQRFTNTTKRASEYSSLPSSDTVNKKKKDIDQYLATTMKSLSIQERNAALEEVNGIVDNELEKVFEVPAILDEKLFELDQHLISIKSGTVYETAECTNPDYVQDRNFRIMFLRGRRYDAKLAAEQMLDFFENKLMLFGRDKLCKDITLDDLDEDERVAIRKGGLQLVEKDVGGRMIVANFKGLVKQKSILNELRTKYYTYMTMLESEEIQKKGAIGIMYVVGDRYRDKKGGGSAMAKMGKLVKSMPIHWAGFHFCCDAMVQFVLIQALILCFPKHLAAKFRCHNGTHQECMYSMRAYGIPPSAVPIPEMDDNKPLLLYKHLIWYQNRERIDREKDQRYSHGMLRQEEPTSTADIIPLDEDEFSLEDPILEEDEANQLLQADEPPRDKNTGSPHLIPAESQKSPIHRNIQIDTAALNTAITPRRTDVLFGPKFKNHPGTLELQKIVSKELVVFESILKRADKTKFVESLVQHLRASGIRFLDFHKETNSWIEVDHKVTRNKVAKIFRNKRRTTGLGPSVWGSMAKVSNDA